MEHDPLPLPEPALTDGTLLLIPWEQRDAAVVLAAGLDQLVSRYRTDRLTGTRLELAIIERGMPVGSASLTSFDHGKAELRYWLLPESRGRGLAARGARLLVAWAFSTLRLEQLEAFIEPSNEASKAVLKRCGFIQQGLLRRHMTGHDGDPVDTLMYQLLSGDAGR